MSRRFGRNQKRRLREEAVKWQQTNERNEGLLRYNREKLQAAESFIQYVLDLLGPDNIANPEPRRVMTNAEGPSYHAIDYGPLRFGSQSCEMAQMTVMNALETQVVRDHFKGAIHVRAVMRNENVCYSMSDAAIRIQPQHNLHARLSIEIARQIAPQLAKALKR